MSREGKAKNIQYIEFTDNAVNPLLRITDNTKDQKNSNTKKDFIPRPKTKPNIVPVHSSGDLLSRVSAFLPKLAQANKELEQAEDKSRFKIELPSDQDDDCSDRSDEPDDSSEDELKGRVIEMNVSLGVLEEERHEEGQNDIRVWIKDDDTSGDSDSSQSKG
jgi:hypothetical protein